MSGLTLPHYNDNMPAVRAAIKSRPPSMSKHFASDTQMEAAKPITLQELQSGVHSYFESVSVPYEEFFGGHNHD